MLVILLILVPSNPCLLLSSAFQVTHSNILKWRPIASKVELQLASIAAKRHTKLERDTSVRSSYRTVFRFVVLIFAVLLSAKAHVSNRPLRSEIDHFLTPERAGNLHSSLD